MGEAAEIVTLHKPAPLPRADVAPLLWAASFKLELAARLVTEAVAEIGVELSPAQRSALMRYADELELAAQDVVEHAIPAGERA